MLDGFAVLNMADVFDATSADVEVVAYPNPSSESVIIDFRKSDFDLDAVQIFDVLRTVHTVDIRQSQYQIEFSVKSLPNGVYTLLAQFNDGSNQAIPFIVAHE